MSSYTMEAEIDTAVAWWTNVLRTVPRHDAGDAMLSGYATLFAHRLCTSLVDEQIAIFSTSLKTGITQLVLSTHPCLDDPLYGSYDRTVGTDYGPDAVLAMAAKEAGIDHANLRFPVKTIMWINPGCVKVAHGYGAEPQVIYGKDKDEVTV